MKTKITYIEPAQEEADRRTQEILYVVRGALIRQRARDQTFVPITESVETAWKKSKSLEVQKSGQSAIYSFQAPLMQQMFREKSQVMNHHLLGEVELTAHALLRKYKNAVRQINAKWVCTWRHQVLQVVGMSITTQ